MTSVLVLAAVFGLLFALAVAALFVRWDRELARIARELESRDPADNARVMLSARSKGLVRLAGAINRELDAEAVRRIADERRRQAAREDLAALSHDIRTPLSGAKGYLQLAVLEEDEKERARYLEAASGRLDAMRELVDGLLEYAKANDESSPLSSDELVVESVLSDVLIALYPKFVDRGWNPDVRIGDEGLTVVADREALGRVLSNLLANALRHGSKEPCIRVDGRGDVVEISVSNEVPDPDLVDPERLFERFYKAGSSRGADGSGLGLSIVSRLCERMGGSATAALEGDELRVSVSLPRSPGGAGQF